MRLESPTRTFHDIVDLHATRTPNALAAICSSESLSYFELAERSNRLAHCLIQSGVTPGSFVGICVERSVHMLVGILAILKAGAAYVPLDPAYPSDRLAYMVTDSAVRCIVAQRSTVESLPAHEARCILLDAFAAEQYSAEPPHVEITPESTAYVIYTSGSTGRPKGVMISHRSLESLAQWTQQRFSAAQYSRVLAASSLSFDVSVLEITTALACGGALVIIRNALDLLLAPPSEAITMMFTLPSPLTELVRARAVPASLHTILVGGEVLTRTLANDIYATTNVTELINAWGVTEDTVLTTEYIVPQASFTDPQIGQPLPGRRLHLLDANLQPVPVGTPGELCCTGNGIASGYLNRPELTRERFVVNPFGDSELMYRSGDLAVQGPNGEIRFIGRNDQQVKIRGHRVELGEIEAALAGHPMIAQAAVIAKMIAGNTSVALYAVAHHRTMLTLPDVERFLGKHLPKHMIPSSLTVLDAMPLGPTGKTDRKALQELVRERPELSQPYVAPRNELEKTIADFFAGLLGIGQVGIHDNFFALGGQSLLATRAVAEISALFPQETQDLEARLGERALFTAFWQQPTIACIAAALQNLPPTDTEAARDENIRCLKSGAADKVPIFLAHGIFNGEPFYTWNIAHALDADQPLYTLAPHGDNGTAVPRTIEMMAADYLTRIRRIQPHGPYRLVGYCNGGLVFFEMARMLEAQGEIVEKLVLIASPGHNVHYRKLERMLEALRWIPGFHASMRRTIFVRIRGRIRHALQLLKQTSRHDETSSTSSSSTTTLSSINAKLRGDAIFLAIDTYVPKPYGGSATLIFGADDMYTKRYTPNADWAQVVANLQTVYVPGNHHFIEKNPEVVVKHFFSDRLQEHQEKTLLAA